MNVYLVNNALMNLKLAKGYSKKLNRVLKKDTDTCHNMYLSNNGV